MSAGLTEWCCELPSEVLAGRHGLAARVTDRIVNAVDGLFRCDEENETEEEDQQPSAPNPLSNFSQHWVPALYCCIGMIVVILTYVMLYAIYLSAMASCNDDPYGEACVS